MTTTKQTQLALVPKEEQDRALDPITKTVALSRKRATITPATMLEASRHKRGQRMADAENAVALQTAETLEKIVKLGASVVATVEGARVTVKQTTLTLAQIDDQLQDLAQERYIKDRLVGECVAIRQEDKRETLTNAGWRMELGAKQHQVNLRKLDAELRSLEPPTPDHAAEAREQTRSTFQAQAVDVMKDVVQKDVRTDSRHRYQAAAALLYYTAVVGGTAEPTAYRETVEYLIDRMQRDPIELPEAHAKHRRWEQLAAEMDAAARSRHQRAQDEAAYQRTKAERDAQRAHEAGVAAAKADAERERRRAAEMHRDTFGGDDFDPEA